MNIRNTVARIVVAVIGGGVALGAILPGLAFGSAAPDRPVGSAHTTTPITHLVVIFQENVSFDHYFATYPTATNPAAQPAFAAAPGTPTVDGLSAALLTANPNAVQPFRLDRSQAETCDQDHLSNASCGTTPSAALGGFADRCGYGPRLPLRVISPYARTNFVDHTVTDQSSVLRFIEDNWATGRIGNGSFDAVAGPLTGMFDFSSHHGDSHELRLDPATGLVTH